MRMQSSSTKEERGGERGGGEICDVDEKVRTVMYVCVCVCNLSVCVCVICLCVCVCVCEGVCVCNLCVNAFSIVHIVANS